MSALIANRRALLCVAGIALLGIGWAFGRAQRSSRHTATVTAAIARLEAQGKAEHVVAVNLTGGLATGAYVCREPRLRSELEPLTVKGGAPRWQGVVRITLAHQSDPCFPDSLEEWGENAAVVGKVLLFGDAQMVKELSAALRK